MGRIRVECAAAAFIKNHQDFVIPGPQRGTRNHAVGGKKSNQVQIITLTSQIAARFVLRRLCYTTAIGMGSGSALRLSGMTKFWDVFGNPNTPAGEHRKRRSPHQLAIKVDFQQDSQL
jgi:hypothetical protein